MYTHIIIPVRIKLLRVLPVLWIVVQGVERNKNLTSFWNGDAIAEGDRLDALSVDAAQNNGQYDQAELLKGVVEGCGLGGACNHIKA